jgi:subtilase family serine protease
MNVRRALVVLALAAAALGATSAAQGASVGSWTATATQALHLKGTLLGAARAGQRLEISVVLPLRHSSSIDSAIQAQRILTPAQVAATYGPTRSQVAAVESYLRRNGFTQVSASTNRLLVTGHATVAQAQRAFDTHIARYRLGRRTVYANTEAARVPASLSRDVVAVLGLHDVPMSLPRSQASSTPDLNGFGPQAVAKAYDDSTMKPAGKTPIAVIASGDMTGTIEDLRFAEKQFKEPQTPVKVVYDGPRAGIVENNPLSGNLEWDLDTQISTMVPRLVKRLYIYDVGTFTDPEVARGINMFVAQDKARALSASLGECDYIAFLDGAMVASDEMLAEGALQGQSMFASTGDNGYACPEVASTGVPEGPPGDSWPADGEYTTAVGGTTLLADSSGNVQNELAWVGGGGGISPWETAAPWTLQANTAGQTWEFTNQGGRGVPDVAALADPFTPYLVYGGHTKGTTPSGVGGTSVSSPLTLGLWASLEAAHRNRLGLAQYDFYKVYDKTNPATVESGPLGPVFVANPNPSPVKGFRDVTIGTNGGCVAKPGYDYCTGIGSLQVADLSTVISK